MSVLILLAASGLTYFSGYAIQYGLAGKLLTGDFVSLASSILIAPLITVVLLWPFRRKNTFVMAGVSFLSFAVVGYAVFVVAGLVSGEPGLLIWALETSLLFVAPTLIVFVALSVVFFAVSFAVRRIRAQKPR